MAFSRRDFLKRTCCTAAAGFAAASFNRFGLVNALAQSSQDYKALVCVFLFGGNDSNNMVMPFQQQRLRFISADPLGAGPAPEQLAADRSAQRGFVRIPSQIPRDAGAVQPEASGGAGQRRHAGSTHHPDPVSARPSQSSAEPFLPRRPADANANRHARQQRADGMGGRTADKIQSIYGGTFPVIISLAGTNIFCEGLRRVRFESSGDPTKLLVGLQQFGRIPEPIIGAAEPADLRYRRLSDSGGQHNDHQRPAGQQYSGRALAQNPPLATAFPATTTWPGN